MGASSLTGTEFARITRTYSTYSLSWIGSYTYTQDPVANTTTLTLYGSLYTGSSTNVRSSNSTDLLKVNGVTLSPPTPTDYRYSSNQTYGYSVNNGYSLFGSTTKTITHNSNGTFPDTEISIYANSYQFSDKSKTGTISGLPTIDRTAPTVTAAVSQKAETTVTFTLSANVNCNKWEYKVDSGSWVSFSTTNGTSASTTVSLTTGASHTITGRATKTYNGVTGTSSGVTADKSSPTVSCTATNNAATSVTLAVSSNVNCNKWEYKVGNGSWASFSTTNGKSASTTVSGLSAGSTGTIYARATRTDNYVTSTASASYDKTAPSISSATISSITANSCALAVTTNVNCDKWEYQVGSGSWTTYSSTNSKSQSTTISGLSPATTYTINVRVTNTVNWVTATTSKSVSTLGYSTLTSVANVNVDSNTTLTWTPYSSSFAFKVRFYQGNTTRYTSGAITPSSTSSYSYTATGYSFPASTLPSTTSDNTWTARLYTYTDSTCSTQVGHSDKTFTVSVPNNNTYKPSATITLSDYNTNSWFQSKHLYISGYTRVLIGVNNPAAGSGANTPTVSAVSPASTLNSTSPAINYLTNSTFSKGTQTFSVTLTDSRSRTRTYSVSQSFIAYSAPSVSQFSTERGTYSGSTWTADPNGSHIHAVVVATCSLTDKGNAIATKTVKCGNANANITSGNNYYWTSTSAETSYEVTVSLTDSAGFTSTYASHVGAIAVPFNLNTTKPAAAFGKVAETTRALELADNWKLIANGKSNMIPYLPYSWEAYSTESPQTAGYMRIATVKITGTYANNSIVIEGQLRASAYVSRLFLSFTSTDANTEPAVNVFTRDGYRICSAYIIRTAAYTWDVYMEKQTANERITVRVYTSANLMSKANITFAPADYQPAIPSGAQEATTPITPPIQLQTNQYYNEDKYGINMRNSDIIGANGIWFADTANARDEGIIYVRSNGNYDTLYAYDGDVYLRRNQVKNGTVVAGTRLLTVDDIPRDYVTNEWTEAWGSWGTWYCVAWSSGKRECYGTFTYPVPASGWSAWGSVYEAQPTTAMTISYPGSFFSAAPTLHCSVSGAAGAIGYELYGSNTKTTGPKVIVLRPNSLGSATTYYVHLHAIGPA